MQAVKHPLPKWAWWSPSPRTWPWSLNCRAVSRPRAPPKSVLEPPASCSSEIDAAPYRATLQSAQASVARAEATLAQATALTDRYKPLVEANAISKQDYTTAVAAQKQAEADLASAKAAVETARINLGYASVTAPISGRIGRALVTEGALVGQGEVTQLATIQQIHPVYVNFTQSASDVMRLRSAMDAGQLKKVSGQDAASVRIVLDDGTEYGQTGKLLCSDLTVDATSGTIEGQGTKDITGAGGILRGLPPHH